MRMYDLKSRRRNKRFKKAAWLIGGIALAAVIIILVSGRVKDNGKNDSAAVDAGSLNDVKKPFFKNRENRKKIRIVDHDADKPAAGVDGMTRGLADQIGPSPITIAKMSRQDAGKAYEQGMGLYSGGQDFLSARKLLNDAYNSGELHEVQAKTCREALTRLAGQTILRPLPYVSPRDPYMLSYTFVSGDRLGSDIRGGRIVKPGVVARNNLNVPVEIIPMVNGLKSATKFQAGKAYKLLKGPFHIVVYKGSKTADIYLQDLFLKRIPVCTGAVETPTPEGFFRVVDRSRGAVYNAPSGSGQPNITLAQGDPGYPLGSGGLNIKIEGIQQLGTDIPVSMSYAIHGTNDPSSIGRPASRGCIRLGRDDINFVYAIMQSYGDRNNPAVSWDRWSTVWIRK